jgi:hypothetical protein
MPLHPPPEIADERRFANPSTCRNPGFTDIDPDQVLMKALRAEVDMMVCFTSFCIWTTARQKMLTEDLQHLRTYLDQRSAIHQHEAAQMIGGPYVPHGARR